MHQKEIGVQKAIHKYVEEKAKLGSVAPVAPYDWTSLNSTLSIEWMAYSQFLNEHARELSNSINEFRKHVACLMAWEKALVGLDEDEKQEAIREFVSPLATIALNTPYVVRSRFIYSVAHLSHQANRLKQSIWVDDLPVDSEIYFNEADQYGMPWNRYPKLKVALEKIANKEYEKHTHDFRNKYNHRYSPRIEAGLTGLVNRVVHSDESVSYEYGQTDPLMLKDINPLLKVQHGRCLAAHEKYRALVNDQVTEINNA